MCSSPRTACRKASTCKTPSTPWSTATCPGPPRHEQREGRVDRFGQHSPKVRATLLYGATNPVDGVVLEVILRKAEAVHADLGVPVPIPDDGHALSQALMMGP